MVATLRMVGHMTEISSTENTSRDINHGLCANELTATSAISITGLPPLLQTCASDVTISLLDDNSGSFFYTVYKLCNHVGSEMVDSNTFFEMCVSSQFCPVSVWMCFHVCFRSPGSMVNDKPGCIWHCRHLMVSQQRAWFWKLSQCIGLDLRNTGQWPLTSWFWCHALCDSSLVIHPESIETCFFGYRVCSQLLQEPGFSFIFWLNARSTEGRSGWIMFDSSITITERSNMIETLFLELMPAEFFVNVEGVVILCFLLVPFPEIVNFHPTFGNIFPNGLLFDV